MPDSDTSLPYRATATLADIVRARFADRPTLRSVVTQMLRTAITEKYFDLDIDRLRLARRGQQDAPLLVDIALDYLGTSAGLAVFSAEDAYLELDAVPLTYATDATYEGENKTLDLEVIAQLIRELPLTLHIVFQERLAAYWNQEAEPGFSRWQWLADLLQGALRTASARTAGLNAEQLHLLAAICDFPDRRDRAKQALVAHAYTLETRVTRAGLSVDIQAPDLLLVNGQTALLFRVSGTLERYPNLDAFGIAWGQRLEQQFLADTLTWCRYEPDGDIFDIQAALILNQQLEDLATLKLPTRGGVERLEQRFANLTNPAVHFLGSPSPAPATLEPLARALPAWLRQASAEDSFAYRQRLLAQVGLHQANQGRSYLDGIEDIRRFAAKRLREQMRLDQPQAPGYDPDQLELTFAVPVGTLGSGYLEPVTMSLTDLALKNLTGKPKGSMTIRHTGDQLIQDWTTPQYLEDLVGRIDIGKHYPQLIASLLIDDSTQAREREALFRQQRPAELAQLALELQIKGQFGLTRRGCRYVDAVMQPTTARRMIDDNEIVMRPLALLRRPGAMADVVSHMFIIEPLNPDIGPHLLYRPLYAEQLHEYPSRAALLQAIAQPGALQDSVLTWLSNGARAVYDHGGFIEPHYVRFGVGSEFAPLERPKPATLAAPDDDSALEWLAALRSGQLLAQLYGSEARALVDQAEQQSVSTAESRWAVFLEGSGLLFNTLLMAVRGPLAAVGWLWQLTASLQQDIPALADNDPATREPALIDLLLNIAQVLLHAGLPSEPAPSLAGDALRDTQLALERVRRPTPYDTPGHRAILQQGTVGIPAEPPAGGRTLVDFPRSASRDSALAHLLEQLLGFNVPWPSPLPEPYEYPPLKGLYRIDGKFYVSVAGLLFRASVVPGFNEVFIIDEKRPDHRGLKLKTDGHGRWTLDRGLTLEGGGPGPRIQALLLQQRQEAERLATRKLQIQQDLNPLIDTQNDALIRLRATRTEQEVQHRKLQLVWRLLNSADDAQLPGLQARHTQEMENAHALRTQVKILLETYQQRLQDTMALRQELIDVLRKIEDIDRKPVHAAERYQAYTTIWRLQLAANLMIRELGRDLMFSSRGEPLYELRKRTPEYLSQGIPVAYYEFIANYTENLAITDQLIAATEDTEQTLAQLALDSPAGAATRDTLLASVTQPEVFFAMNLKLNSLELLRELSLDLTAAEGNPMETYYSNQLQASELRKVITAHIEMRCSSGYSLQERRSVFETILVQYKQFHTSSSALADLNSAYLRQPFQARFVERLHEALNSVESELEALAREEEQLQVNLPVSVPFRPKAASKRVFKVRNKGSLIGDVTPRTADQPLPQIDVVDVMTHQAISSFSEHEDGWVEVITQAPQRVAPVTPPRALPALREAGQKLMAQRAGIEGTIRFQQNKLKDPQRRQGINPLDWDTMLNTQADQLDRVADEIRATHLDKPQAQALLDEFQGAARDMRQQARQFCIDGYKQQLPSPEHIDYLWINGAVDINLVHRAKPTAAGDFLAEYAIREKGAPADKVLWYAHFHYASADAAKVDYSRAHLKLPHQRFLTQKDLLLRQQPGQEKIADVVYVRIYPPLDRKLFLNL